MVRSPPHDDGGLKKGPWTPEEDRKLLEYVEKHGRGSWQRIPKLAGLNRCGKSCRLRWTNYLRPDIKRGKFTEEEEQKIIHLHSLLGNKWSSMATKLPGRTDNEIKNYWNTHLKKKLLRMGIDPVTHQPTTTTANLSLLAGLSTLLSPAAAGGTASHLDNALKLVQVDVAHLLRLQLVQNLFQVLSSGGGGSTSSSISATTSNMNLIDLFGSHHTRVNLPSSSVAAMVSNSNLAMLSQLLTKNGGSFLQPVTEPSFSTEEEADASRTEEASMEISNGGSSSSSFPPPPPPPPPPAPAAANASNSTPSLVSSSSSSEMIKNTDLLKSNNNNNNNNNIYADNNNSPAIFDAWDSIKLDNLDNDFGWKEIIEEMTWPDAPFQG